MNLPDIPPLFAHQEQTAAKARPLPGFFDASDPGTGKTRGHLEDFARTGGRMLVFGPKSVLQSAWGNDIDKFFPGMTYAVANANNRAKAFDMKTDVVITNHDAAVWLMKNPKYLDGFNRVMNDESTAYKNPQAQRSKAAYDIAKRMKYRRAMCATPNPISILEMWNQIRLVDDGERLGKSYWKFRNVACEPFQNGPKAEHIEWRDKPGIEAAVFALISDICIRHERNKCISLPDNQQSFVHFELSNKCKKYYQDMYDHSMITLRDSAVVRAINASAVTNKLLQIASGAMYTGEEDKYVVLDEERTELVMDLLESRKHSLVAFNWKHQRDQLVAAAQQRGYPYAVIDGEVSANDRTKIVADMQAGKLKVLFAQPKSAGHGLTLTRATTTIWASPTYQPDIFKQFNSRIDRVGQTEKMETIMVCAAGTVDEGVYKTMDSRMSSMQFLLSLLEAA